MSISKRLSAVLVLATASVSFGGIVTTAGVVPTVPAGPFDAGAVIRSPAAADPTTVAQTNQQIGANQALAQTITPQSSFQLDRIQILSGGRAGGVATLHIYPVNTVVTGQGGTDTDGFVNTSFSTDLLNGGAGLTFGFTGSGSTNILVLDLTAADEVTLTAGTQYAIEIVTANDGATSFSWQRSNQGEYAFGNIYQANPAESGFNGTAPANGRGQRNAVGGSPQRDGLFAMYAVPEPSSLALLGLGGLAALRRRRD